MSIFGAMNSSASGLTMQRLRMDLISQNIANVDTTKTKNGMPYRRKVMLVEEKSSNSFADIFAKTVNGSSEGSGVKVSKIVEDKRPFNKVYNPGHPDADKDGYVNMPNVNVVEEMVNMISASRSYEANVTAINSTKSMAMKALEIGK